MIQASTKPLERRKTASEWRKRRTNWRARLESWRIRPKNQCTQFHFVAYVTGAFDIFNILLLALYRFRHSFSHIRWGHFNEICRRSPYFLDLCKSRMSHRSHDSCKTLGFWFIYCASSLLENKKKTFNTICLRNIFMNIVIFYSIFGIDVPVRTNWI